MVWKAVLPLSCLLAVAAAQNASNTSSIPEAATTATSTEGVCAFDDGIDFIGNDIKNVPGKSAGDCCSPCQATLGCGAFTWSNFNGGTCWLKSSKGQVTFASGVKSGVVQRSGLEVDTDYVGNDVSNTLASKADDCFDKCKSTSGCKAFSWNNFNGGTCWLKSGRGEVRSSKGVYSAVVGSDSSPTPPAGKCVVEKDVDYTGYDMGNVPGVDATACCSKCSGITGCKAFSWSGWNGGTCWLKSARGKAVASPGVSSGVISNPPPEQCSLKTGEDYVGNDIGSSPSATAAECCELCRKKDGCHAFTWTDWNNGVCWFKSSRGEIRPNPSAVSGVVEGNSADSRHVQYSIRSGAIPARSVNLGSWLVTEYWMSYTSPLYKGVPENIARAGEYAIMKYLGTEQGTKQFEEHRSTWLTEEDIAEIASTGLNTVRVPVGFWIVDDDSVNPPTDISRVYARGGLKYLDKLINQWAVKYNLAVMLSLHAHQGSQNGYDHSAPQEMDKIEWWKWPNNIENSLRFATYLAARYKDAPAFLGLNLMNEPSGDTRQDVLEKYYLDAYQRIRANGNSCVIGTSPHLWYQDQWQMREFMRWPAYTNVWQEYHVYYKWGQFVSIPNILDAARNYYKGHFDDWPGNWQYMGEWSLATPDSLPINDRNTLKEFAAIQLEQYSRAHAGWAFWAWRHDDETITQRDKNFLSAWCMRQLLREGIFTVPK